MQHALEANLQTALEHYFNSFLTEDGVIPEYNDEELKKFAEEIQKSLQKDIEILNENISAKVSLNLLLLVKEGKINNLLTPDLKK